MTDTAIRPEAWTPIERLNVREHGRRAMDRVGVVEPAKLAAGAQFVVAWGPRGKIQSDYGDTGPLVAGKEADELIAMAEELRAAVSDRYADWRRGG